MIKIKDNKKVKKISKKSKNTIVGGYETNISNMNTKDKLELLRDISDLPKIKKIFKNSPFDKNNDTSQFNTIGEFINYDDTVQDVKNGIQIIKYILMCLYLGEDECYYYLYKYVKSIDNAFKEITGKDLDNYSIEEDDINYKSYKKNADLLFNDLISKIENFIKNQGKNGIKNPEENGIGSFLETKYIYKLYLKKIIDTINTIDNLELYVPIKYYNSVNDTTIKGHMTDYKREGEKANNIYYKLVKPENSDNIIKNIQNSKQDTDDIIVIMQKSDKTVLYPEKLTGTMIIGFLNSLYDTPSIYKEYEEIINQNVIKFNTMFFINLFIKKNISSDLDDDTLAELLANLRRSAIGFYENIDIFMKLVNKSIDQQDATAFFKEKLSKINAKVDIINWVTNKDCSDQNNKTGIINILFYSFMFTNENFDKDNNYNKIIIQKLKTISKRWLINVAIKFIKGEIDDCDKIIDGIILEDGFLDGFTLYTNESIKKLDNNTDYTKQVNNFISTARKVKEKVVNSNSKVKYNSSINLYKTKYSLKNSTDTQNIESLTPLII